MQFEKATNRHNHRNVTYACSFSCVWAPECDSVGKIFQILFFLFFFCLRYHERRNHSVEQSCASVSTAYSLASLVHTIQIVNLNMK